MCLIAVGYGASSDYALVVAANRDERHARPTAAAAWWPEDGRLLGGRDLAAGGSWLAIDERGRMAAVTNQFEGDGAPAARSRGELVVSFVRNDMAAATFGEVLTPDLGQFAAFNLLIFDGASLHYVSNRAPARLLRPGVHALSNASPETDWPKVRRARDGLAGWLERNDPMESLFGLLAQQSRRDVPDYRRESLFVVGEEFGTRCSTVLAIRRDGAARLVERTFDPAGALTGETAHDFVLRRSSSA